MLEIDHFKSINDAFGHLRGDTAIREFAERIQGSIRPQDMLFRYGGDEFVLILPQTNAQTAQPLAQQTIDHVNRQPFAGDPPLTISVSGGVALFPADGQTAEALFARADRRCRRAKQVARGQLISDDSLSPESEQPIQQPSRLIERDQELEQLHRFISAIPHNPINVLQITGRAGSGASRFMAEAREAARLHGFATLEVHGRPGIKTRIFGALADARLGWKELLVPELGVAAFVRGLCHVVGVSDYRGMVITLDDLAGIDRSSLEFIRDIITSGGMKNLALIYADGDSAAGGMIWTEVTPTARIELTALSRHGIRVWLRHSLHWEAPEGLIDWLFSQTDGLPAKIEEALKELVTSNRLRRQAKGWRYPANLTVSTLFIKTSARKQLPYHNLPSQSLNFIGREHQIRALHDLLHKKPLITIVGVGGIGKTKLALQVASEELDAFPDGIFFIPLAALATIYDLLIGLAAALQVPIQEFDDLKTQILGYLHNKRALLIFDHLAHRHHGEALLTEMLDNAPSITLLITTREQLNLPYQALLELSGLPYPENVDELEIERYEAVQLFLRSAQQINNDTCLADKAHIVQICQLVAGVPLALELAASFTQDMSIAEIAAGLEQSLLSFAMEQAHHQHGLSIQYHSLLAVFDSFWQSLSATEQETLSRLALFQGGFTAHAASAVAGASPFFLGSLSARSYLQRVHHQRYALHEMLRQYSLAWLSIAQVADVQHKHCYYYAAYVAAAETRMTTQSVAVSEFGQELDNIRAAWQWALENSQPTAVQQICGGLARFYLLRGQHQEAKAILHSGLAEIAQQAIAQAATYTTMWSRLLEMLDQQISTA